MPALKFPQFLKRFKLTILRVATDDVIPGAVLSPRRGYIYQGHLSELLAGQPKKFWKTELDPANIVYGTVEREFSLSGKASLDQMGVKVEGGLGRAKSVKYSISAVHAQTFLNGTGHASMFSLTPRLHQLKKRNRRAWRMVNNKWVVLETYYASEAEVTFATSGSVDLKGDVENAGGVSVHGGGGIKWTGERSFKIIENNAVPFAFRGWKV